MEVAIILGVLAAAANIVLIGYAKKCNKRILDESSNPKNESHLIANGFPNTQVVEQLRKSTAAELGLPVEELDRMLAREINQLSREQEKINLG